MVNIYVIENNINNKLYVGRTSQTLNKRMKCHRANANSYLKNSNSKCLPFHKEMAKLGIQNFSIKLLEVCDDSVANECKSTVGNLCVEVCALASAKFKVLNFCLISCF